MEHLPLLPADGFGSEPNSSARIFLTEKSPEKLTSDLSYVLANN